MDEKALDEYNKQNNTPTHCFQHQLRPESSAVIPAGKVVSNPVTITLHPLTTEQNKTGFVHAPIAVKAEGKPCRCSKAPTIRLGRNAGSLFERSRDHATAICKHVSPKITNSSWTFETLFNPSQIYTGNTTTWLASAIGTTSRAARRSFRTVHAPSGRQRRRHEEQPDQRHGQPLRQTDLLHPAPVEHLAPYRHRATKVTPRLRTATSATRPNRAMPRRSSTP
ncbi:MAG: DUF1735 domain-containing protein [Alistipes finegoldii]